MESPASQCSSVLRGVYAVHSNDSGDFRLRCLALVAAPYTLACTMKRADHVTFRMAVYALVHILHPKR
jgi:hypothetical protein